MNTVVPLSCVPISEVLFLPYVPILQFSMFHRGNYLGTLSIDKQSGAAQLVIDSKQLCFVVAPIDSGGIIVSDGIRQLSYITMYPIYIDSRGIIFSAYQGALTSLTNNNYKSLFDLYLYIPLDGYKRYMGDYPDSVAALVDVPSTQPSEDPYFIFVFSYYTDNTVTDSAGNTTTIRDITTHRYIVNFDIATNKYVGDIIANYMFNYDNRITLINAFLNTSKLGPIQESSTVSGADLSFSTVTYFDCTKTYQDNILTLATSRGLSVSEVVYGTDVGIRKDIIDFVSMLHIVEFLDLLYHNEQENNILMGYVNGSAGQHPAAYEFYNNAGSITVGNTTTHITFVIDRANSDVKLFQFAGNPANALYYNKITGAEATGLINAIDNINKFLIDYRSATSILPYMSFQQAQQSQQNQQSQVNLSPPQQDLQLITSYLDLTIIAGNAIIPVIGGSTFASPQLFIA